MDRYVGDVLEQIRKHICAASPETEFDHVALGRRIALCETPPHTPYSARHVSKWVAGTHEMTPEQSDAVTVLISRFNDKHKNNPAQIIDPACWNFLKPAKTNGKGFVTEMPKALQHEKKVYNYFLLKAINTMGGREALRSPMSYREYEGELCLSLRKGNENGCGDQWILGSAFHPKALDVFRHWNRMHKDMPIAIAPLEKCYERLSELVQVSNGKSRG